MAQVTMEQIKELRKKTGVGMMDCKKALVETDGNIEKAIETLRKKGTAVASKRADNETNNGRIAAHIAQDGSIGALLKISCETDFSANTADMANFAQTLAEQVAVNNPSCVEASDTAHVMGIDTVEAGCTTKGALLEQKLFNNEKLTIANYRDDLIAKIGENVKIANFTRFETTAANGLVYAYIHPGATVATMVELAVNPRTDANTPILKELAKDICMQIAVTSPLSITPEQLDESDLEKEKDILKEQLLKEGKPEAMIEKIMIGKLKKYYEDVCLLHQKYIKNDKISVQQHIIDAANGAGAQITVKNIKRFGIGR